MLFSKKTIGILGGGQLGKMMAQAAQQLGFKVCIYCPNNDSPAFQVTNQYIQADYDDKISLKEFAQSVDVITYEFENIPYETVKFLEEIKIVYPNSNVLKICQNRMLEKSFLKENNIDTTNFRFVSNKEEFDRALKEVGLPAILKTCEQGYDGKGQYIIKSKEYIENIWQKADQSSKNKCWILENFINLDYEVSVIVARNINGDISCYPLAKNIHKDNILYTSEVPANIDNKIEKKAQENAVKIATKLKLVGIMAVEYFVSKSGDLLVNEMAPRPHNSGHWTMDGCITSQFEQVIRAINNLHLGSVKVTSNILMKNLLGDEINHIDDYINNPNAKLHIYGKDECKDGRKMGHVNIIIN